MLATIIITGLIALAVFWGMRSFIKGKGSCGDCDCSCPVKDEMRKSSKVK
ncbi:FeoB-associated Cys-rich membrane protein [Streptococcus caballi]|nr:FeoB-associated Cys-rich membrane protein [Streptococcus caballi]